MPRLCVLEGRDFRQQSIKQWDVVISMLEQVLDLLGGLRRRCAHPNTTTGCMPSEGMIVSAANEIVNYRRFGVPLASKDAIYSSKRNVGIS